MEQNMKQEMPQQEEEQQGYGLQEHQPGTVKLMKTNAGKGLKLVVDGKWFYTSLAAFERFTEGEARSCNFRTIEGGDNAGGESAPLQDKEIKSCSVCECPLPADYDMDICLRCDKLMADAWVESIESGEITGNATARIKLVDRTCCGKEMVCESGFFNGSEFDNFTCLECGYQLRIEEESLDEEILENYRDNYQEVRA